jgi:glycolate oxidase iron-sulfur subunit
MVAILQKELDTNFKYEVAAEPGGENIKRCFSCGACAGGCLISEITPEFDPRKLIRMVLLGMKEKVLSSPAIWLCLLCHNCSFHCPQDVKFSEVITALRYLAIKEHYYHPSFFRKILFQGILASHTRLELLSRPLMVYQAAKLSNLLRRAKVFDVLPKRLGNLEFMAPPIVATPMRRQIKTVTPATGRQKHRVAFFPGCADDIAFASAGLATVSVLSRNGCEVVTPQRAECCGMPCLGYGELEQALALVRHNINVFEAASVEFIISDCATCSSFLRSYGDLMKKDPVYAERAQTFSQKVRDISEFLVESTDLKSKDLSVVKGKITYHDPCHLLWAQKVSQQPRRIINQVPGMEIIEMRESDSCCGGAGSYNMTHYEISMNILDRKMKNIIATGAEFVATGCPGCRIQLSLGIKQRGLSSRVVHPIELLNKAYGVNEG